MFPKTSCLLFIFWIEHEIIEYSELYSSRRLNINKTDLVETSSSLYQAESKHDMKLYSSMSVKALSSQTVPETTCNSSYCKHGESLFFKSPL
jgi:hypothetical protein